MAAQQLEKVGRGLEMIVARLETFAAQYLEMPVARQPETVTAQELETVTAQELETIVPPERLQLGVGCSLPVLRNDHHPRGYRRCELLSCVSADCPWNLRYPQGENSLASKRSS